MSQEETRLTQEFFEDNLHEITFKEENSVIIFQVPHSSEDLRRMNLDGAQAAIEKCLPLGRTSLIIGNDINVYELAEADAIVLKLKGVVRG